MDGLWRIATDDLDGGVLRLSEALRVDPTASLHSDLAAALILRSAQAGYENDLPAALNHTLRALELDPGLEEAQVNNAIALTSLGLRHPAMHAWSALHERGYQELANAYMPSDRSAQSHSAGTRGARLLGKWAEYRLQGNTAAAGKSLTMARVLAAEAERLGDTLLSESVAAIDEAKASNPGRLKLLAQGHATLQKLRGQDNYSKCDLDGLVQVGVDLRSADSPFAVWADVDRAVCDYFEGNYSSATSRLEAAIHRWSSPYRPTVSARCHALLGLASMVQSKYDEADRHYRDSIEFYHAAGEAGEALYQQALRARNLALGGLDQLAWRLRLPVLHRLNEISTRERAVTVVQDLVQTLRRLGYRRAASVAMDELIEIAELAALEEGGEGDMLAYVLIEKATLLLHLDDERGASQALDRAEEAWLKLPAGQEIRETIGIELAAARALMSGDSSEGIDRALDYYMSRDPENAGNRLHVVRLLKTRSDLARKRSDWTAAISDLGRGLAEIDRQRQRIRDPGQRARFAGYQRELIEDLVRMARDRLDDPVAALAAWDAAVGRLAYDSDPMPAAALNADSLASLVPEGGAVIRWGHLSEGLMIWTITQGGHLELEFKRIETDSLRRLAFAFRESIRRERADEEGLEIGRSLAELVLPKGLSQLPQDAPLLLVPDQMLSSVPWVALPLRDGRSLVERHRVAFAPQLGLLLRPEPRARQILRTDSLKELLVVANPDLRSTRFAHLPELRATTDRLSRAYPDTTLLLGPEATWEAVREALPRHRILHAATHGITDAGEPDRGGLLLAPSPGNPEILTANDLDPLELGSLQLVVLAACRTALDNVPESADFAGLAGALLARGVPEVVTTAWNVEDERTADFFVRFHQHLSSGLPTADALRAAQVESIQKNRASAVADGTWAAFRVDVSRAPQTDLLHDEPPGKPTVSSVN